jgi:four helix bundle protein
MKINTFEEIIAWQKAKTLTVDMYKICKSSKDYGFRDQLQRATVSIMNNIAEGFERRSNKEFRQFLYISKCSCGEVRSMLHLAKELGYVSEVETEKFIERATEISKMLSGFIKQL